MPLIARTIEEALAPIADGCMLLIPRESSGVPMEATRALIRRRLHLVTCPTSTLQADLLIGAGCVEMLETSAVSLNEFGAAPRFIAAVTSGAIRLKDTTCPALHAALQATEKGVPFMPLRGLIGSDVLAHRGDWRTIDNPFGSDDPIVLIPAIKGDVALFHAPMADRDGKKTILTVETLHDGNLLDDPQLAAGTLAGFYVEAVALAPRGAWPLRLAEHYPTDAAHLAEYARLAVTAKFGARPSHRRVRAVNRL